MWLKQPHGMSVTAGAIIAHLFLILLCCLFAVAPAAAMGWLRIKRVIVKPVTIVIEPEKKPADLTDPLAVYPVPIDEDTARNERIKERIAKRTIPTLLPCRWSPLYVYEELAINN